MSITSLTTTEEARSGFYPTPPEVADKLLAGIDWDKTESVLEPSAGKGNLVKAVLEKYARNAKYSYSSEVKIHVDAVEIDPYLRSILRYEFCGRRKSELHDRKQQLEESKTYDYDRREYLWPSEDARLEVRATEEEIRRLDRLWFNVVHDDFLTFQSRKHYDLIVMNPPFADGDAHLLKAIELQKADGGIIRCLLNAETIRNPYTNRRKILLAQLSELGAEISFLDGAFVDSERGTDVAVALIKVKIPEPKRSSVIFERLQKAAELETPPPSDVTEMTVSDFMSQIVTRFNVEVDAGLALIREYAAMKPYILQNFEDCYANNPTLTLCVGDPDRLSAGLTPNANRYLCLVRKKYWTALFSNKEFVGKLTTNLRDKYRKMVGKMAVYDFTLFNIQQIAEQMNAEMGQGLQDTIVALFDKLTEKHSWYPEMSKNIHYYNGWKTNKVHKINSKVIIPIYGVFSSYSWSKETFNVHEAENTISDIEKVFDYLDGDATAEVDLHGVLLRACEEGRTRNIPCKFFDVTLYKKGTMHIKFRNQALVDKFNIYCCRKKNWLPPNYGKSAYTDMTAEERTVVDGFHGDGSEGAGEAAYQAVMTKAAYFLAEPTQAMPALMAPAT